MLRPKNGEVIESPEEEPVAQELSPELREMQRGLARMYLENVPPSYLHMAVAMHNLQRFTADELRAELVRRDESPAFPDPSKLQEELEQLEEAALEAAAASLGVDELDEPPPTPRLDEPDDFAVIVDDNPPSETE